ncbi:MAG: hypothetical protein C4516_04255 [Oxalobacter sp.]|nr:MAG: hypothetical protein C4516_04255 [Oxalobacter sp.]
MKQKTELKAVLQRHRIKQTVIAKHLELSEGAVAQIVNHGAWPSSRDVDSLKKKTAAFLLKNGVPQDELKDVFSQPNQTTQPTQTPEKGEPTKEELMLLRKQSLLPATRKHFQLFFDPFSDDIQSHEDMYVNPEIRYVRESIFQIARHGGMLAVVAESGAGKTTLMRDLEDRIARENQPIRLIRPYVLAMEDNDAKGKTLKATHIAEAIMAAVSPLEKPKSSPEARFAQLHRCLTASGTAGFRHCLVIDEAHSLPLPTIKHLKRFFELEHGFKKLLSIILLGQPELRIKLSESSPEVREVVQRCEMVELAPIESGRLEEYLQFKFKRRDKPLGDIIDAAGIEAIKAKLIMTRRDRRETQSLLYPLAVGNMMTAAMNLAAEIGSKVVTADVVRSV